MPEGAEARVTCGPRRTPVRFTPRKEREWCGRLGLCGSRIYLRLRRRPVRERAVVEVVSGSVAIELAGEVVECSAGSVVTFDPRERHAVRAQADARPAG